MADMAHIAILRGIIGTTLRIAQLIQEMGGTHHVITQVIESSAWLLDEIAQYAMRSELSRDMKRALSSSQRELNNLQKLVIKVSSRSRIAGFLLHDADVQTITACTTSIKTVYDKLEPDLIDSVKYIKLAMDNREAIARLGCQFMALSESTLLVCPLPRITGMFPDFCSSGSVNVGCWLLTVERHGKMDSRPLPRANPVTARLLDHGAHAFKSPPVVWGCWSSNNISLMP
ncbi:hypothetical protein JVT61DRAFT_772 [Boletus reticuloceps]|uniref:Uncharacterized protein n=1 Tax=Boletus reticuloceps TaxID=495285 RepID=A0A8I2YZ86_9AGAM|nr:hypothetical protein JVT61DRAFT_772 [Boletus reticuloceps]